MTYLQFFEQILQVKNITKQHLHQLKCGFAKSNDLEQIPSNIKFLAELRKRQKRISTENFRILEKLFQTRPMRTMSGVSILTVLTKPWPCPGKCIYCPTEPDMPKSYLKSEPAAQRAWMSSFDPAKQIKTRIKALTMTGHPTEKIELIILGGTWPSYSTGYQIDFIKQLFATLNNQKATLSLARLQKTNETAKHKCIGLTIETRPDCVSLNLIKRWRKFGVTRVELGVQSLDNRILKTTRRGHNVVQIKKATQLLKDNGFKIVYHVMPGLPASKNDQRSLQQRYQDDIKTIKTLFSNSAYHPDQMKIYPCSVIPNTELYNWWKNGKYQPYSSKDLQTLLPKLKKLIPPYVRLERVVRDIPSSDIAAGSELTNMRQVLQNKEVTCRCIRCREAKNSIAKDSDLALVKRYYKTTGGEEVFLSFEDKKQDKIFALLRLRFPNKFNLTTTLPSLKNCALIRELHTFGKSIPTSISTEDSVQHLGLGKRLMLEAEKISQKSGYKKITVISGVGVRGYYYKLGYKIGKNDYLYKKLT